MMKRTKDVALAFEDCTALQIEENNYKVLKIKDTSKVYKCYWEKEKYIKQELPNFGTLEQLTKK